MKITVEISREALKELIQLHELRRFADSMQMGYSTRQELNELIEKRVKAIDECFARHAIAILHSTLEDEIHPMDQ